mmetsp:Transcript_66803/g.157330  ORF Transcript_66803/g.157330 Transcript_66803/m.157330 type:complete len:231 (-) Transcript_66803:526-1218(-)
MPSSTTRATRSVPYGTRSERQSGRRRSAGSRSPPRGSRHMICRRRLPWQGGMRRASPRSSSATRTSALVRSSSWRRRRKRGSGCSTRCTPMSGRSVRPPKRAMVRRRAARGSSFPCGKFSTRRMGWRASCRRPFIRASSSAGSWLPRKRRLLGSTTTPARPMQPTRQARSKSMVLRNAGGGWWRDCRSWKTRRRRAMSWRSGWPTLGSMPLGWLQQGGGFSSWWRRGGGS